MTHVLAGIIVLLVSGPSFAAEIAVTQCGQTVPRGSRGVLMNDLDCGRKWGTCQGTVPGGACSSAADCADPVNDSCDGPYPMPESAAGVFVQPGAHVELNGHSIRNVWAGIASATPPPGRSTSAGVKIHGPGSILATRDGVTVGKGHLDGFAIHDSLWGAFGGKLVLQDMDTSGNRVGIVVDASGSRPAVHALRVTSDSNQYAGLFSFSPGRVLIKSSHLTGNGTDDIMTLAAPRVVQTVCNASTGLVIQSCGPNCYSFLPNNQPWGVCSGD